MEIIERLGVPLHAKRLDEIFFSQTPWHGGHSKEASGGNTDTLLQLSLLEGGQ